MFCQALAAAELGQYRAHRFVIRSNCHYYFWRFCGGFFILQSAQFLNVTWKMLSHFYSAVIFL